MQTWSSCCNTKILLSVPRDRQEVEITQERRCWETPWPQA